MTTLQSPRVRDAAINAVIITIIVCVVGGVFYGIWRFDEHRQAETYQRNNADCAGLGGRVVEFQGEARCEVTDGYIGEPWEVP